MDYGVGEGAEAGKPGGGSCGSPEGRVQWLVQGSNDRGGETRPLFSLIAQTTACCPETQYGQNQGDSVHI